MSAAGRRFRGLGGLALGLLAMGAGTAVGCGDSFEGDCQETRTCTPDGGSDGDGKDPDSKGGEGASPSGGTSGAPEEPSGGVAGDGQGGGGPQPECSVPADCSNGDPKDGEEACLRGVCTPGNPPPSVLAVTPLADSKDVEPDGSIVIEFSEELDATSVTEKSVQVLDGESPVLGKLSYADNKVTFVPAAPLALSASYRVSVATSIEDAGGAALREPFESTFQVRGGAWRTIDLIPMTSTTYLSRQLPMTARGGVLVAWATEDGTNGCAVSARWFSRGAALMPTVTLPKFPGYCGFLTSASNAEGVATVAWAEAAGVYAWQLRGAEQQGKRELVAPVSVSHIVSSAVSPGGQVSVLYSPYNSEQAGTSPWVRSTDAAGAWLTAAELKAPSSRDQVTAGFGANGDGLAVWPSQAAGVTTLKAASYSSTTGAWSTAATVGPAYHEGGDASLAVAPSGEAVAVWYLQTSVQASYFSGKTWTPPQTISGTARPFTQYTPRGVVYDGSGYVAAWDVDEGEGVYYTHTATFDTETGWGPKASHQQGAGTTSPGSTSLASDGRGSTFLVWAVKGTDQHQFVFRRLRSGSWGPITPVPGATLVGNTPTPGVRISMNASGMAVLAWVNVDTAGTSTGSKLASFF